MRTGKVGRRHMVCLSVGLVMGAGFLLATGAVSNRSTDDELLIAPGRFADITAKVVKDEEIGRMLVVMRKERPFLIVYEGKHGTAEKFAVTDGTDASIALCEFAKQGISDVYISGNAVHAGMQMPVLSFKASGEPGVWTNVRYAALRKPIYKGGKLESIAPSGEVYEDIDFDGQFDVRMVYDEQFQVSGEAIYVDGNWQVIGGISPNTNSRVHGYYDQDTQEAVTATPAGKVRYRFVRGQGWRKQ